MLPLKESDIVEFLKTYPKMQVFPLLKDGIKFYGLFECNANYEDFGKMFISYNIEIFVPNSFPNDYPDYFIRNNDIKPDKDLHILSENKICLGVPLKLMLILYEKPTLLGFTEKVLVSYLYGLSYKLKNGMFPFPDVGHSSNDFYNEYKNMLGLENKSSIKKAFELLSVDVNDANFKKCPCGCPNPYLACQYRNRLEKYRYIASKEWFKEQAYLFDKQESITRKIA